jgi:hypothetical protein
MNLKPAQKLLTWLFALVILTACILPSSTTPLSVAEPQSPVPGMLETIIAQTVAAAQTQTVTHLPSLTSTLTATSTLQPTSTQTPSVIEELFTFAPTYTVSVPTLTQVLSTSPPQSQGDGVSAPVGVLSDKDQRATNFPKVPVEWDCKITEKNPPKGAIIKRKTNFYVTWTLLNNGTKTWTNNGVDFIYTGGFRHEGRPIQDLPATVAPGHGITLRVLLSAPKAPGTYNVFWSLKVGNRLFCHMKHTFEVN